MTRYKQAEFEEDSSSIGSVQLTEGVSTTATHIRYHTTSLPVSVGLLQSDIAVNVFYHVTLFLYAP